MMKKINDDELMNVAGGFTETADVSTKGMDIVCPVCNKGDSNRFDPRVLWDPKMKSVEYHCICGAKFVCYEKQVLMKDEWIKLCKDKDYQYPYEFA